MSPLAPRGTVPPTVYCPPAVTRSSSAGKRVITSQPSCRHDQLLLDPRRLPAVGGGPERLEGEHHALLDHLRMIERDEAREDRLLPDRQPDAVAVLQRERRLLVREAEFLRAWERPRPPRQSSHPAGSSRSHGRECRDTACTHRRAPATPTRPRTCGSSTCGSRCRRGGCRSTQDRPGRSIRSVKT